MVISILKTLALSEAQIILKYYALFDRYGIRTKKKGKRVTSIIKTHHQLFIQNCDVQTLRRMPQKVICSPFSIEALKDIFFIKPFRNSCHH